MAVTIGSNIAALRTVRQLGLTTRDFATSTERLSSGLRINKAADDAAGLAIASRLESDSRVYTQGVRNLSDGISYLSIADGAAGQLVNILTRMRELATQSANGSYSNTQRAALNAENTALTAEYNRIIASTTFQGRRIFADTASRTSHSVWIQAGYGTTGALEGAIEAPVARLVGDNTFGASTTLTGTGSATIAVTPADVDGDGDLDVIATTYNGDGIDVFKNNGNGTFATRQNYSVGANILPVSVAAGDIDGDGDADVAIMNDNGDVYVMRNNGSGTFGSIVSYATGAVGRNVFLADIDRDQDLDLFANSETNGLSYYLLNDGQGSFGSAISFAASDFGLTVANIDQDANPDTAVFNDTNDLIGVRLGNGDATFGVVRTYDAGVTQTRTVRFGDVNGDAVSDMVVGGQDGIAILLGNGNGTFQPPSTVYGVGGTVNALEIADLDADGYAEIAWSSDALSLTGLLVNNGQGTFAAGATLSGGVEFSNSLILADFSGDGVKDLVKANQNFAANAFVFLGNSVLATFYTGLSQIGGTSVSSRSAALSAISTIDTYLNDVQMARGVIGSSYSRFQSAIATVTANADTATAARGRIVDADIADESAVTTRKAILQNVATAVLAQTNQQPQIALTLLGR